MFPAHLELSVVALNIYDPICILYKRCIDYICQPLQSLGVVINVPVKLSSICHEKFSHVKGQHYTTCNCLIRLCRISLSLKGEGYLNVALNDLSYECPIELNQVVTYCYVMIIYDTLVRLVSFRLAELGI